MSTLKFFEGSAKFVSTFAHIVNDNAEKRGWKSYFSWYSHVIFSSFLIACVFHFRRFLRLYRLIVHYGKKKSSFKSVQQVFSNYMMIVTSTKRSYAVSLQQHCNFEEKEEVGKNLHPAEVYL